VLLPGAFGAPAGSAEGGRMARPAAGSFCLLEGRLRERYSPHGIVSGLRWPSGEFGQPLEGEEARRGPRLDAAIALRAVEGRPRRACI